MVATDPGTAAVGSSIGTVAVGVSVSVTFVVSFSMGMLGLLFSATFQEGPKNHHTIPVHMLNLPLYMMRWALLRREMLWK